MHKAIVIALTFLVGCGVGEGRARDVLEQQGFTAIELGGAATWSCGKDDSQSRRFEATNANGRRVSGVVCCGTWGKACTVRW
jgi:hypothetical protein